MEIYSYLTVKDLIEKSLVTDLYTSGIGQTELTSKSVSYFQLTENANIDAYYFLLVQKGHLFMEIDSRSTVARQKELLLFTPFSVACFKGSSDDFAATVLFISSTLFERIPNYSRFHGVLNRMDIHQIALGEEAFIQLGNTFSVFTAYISRQHVFQQGLALVLSDFMLLQIIEELYRIQADRPIHIERKDELLQQFFNLLAIHYKKHHDIGFYAGKIGVSTTYLSRIIRETTRKTAYFYITEKIFTSARHLLACTDYTVAEITSELSFSDQSAFGKFFKAKTGLSPIQYRKRLSTGRPVRPKG